jgi:hypothetical protein
LIEALGAEDLPHAIRLHVPRSISAFDTDPAASALLARLGAENDLRVRHKILRALGRLARTRTTLELDREQVARSFRATIERCRRLAIWRRAIATAMVEHPSRDTMSGEVLCRVLFEELAFELEQVFRVLALLHPGEDFRSIHRAFESGDAVTRASSHELMREVLPHDDAKSLLHIVRIRFGGEAEDPSWEAMSGDAALSGMIDGKSATVAAMTAAYAAEVRAFEVLSHIEARLDGERAGELRAVFEAAARRLGGRLPEAAVG